MKRLFLLLAAGAALASAQKHEFGGVVGGAAIGAEDTVSAAAMVFGAEFCAFCNRGVSLFGEYTHAEGVYKNRSGIDRFDIVATGLRLQGGRRIRPFFDVGFAYGVDSFRYLGGSASHGNPGLVLAGGVAVRVTEKIYIRPQFRLYGFRGFHAVAAGSAGFGIRF